MFNLQLTFEHVSSDKNLLISLISNSVIDEKFLYGRDIKKLDIDKDDLDEVQDMFPEIITTKGKAFVASGIEESSKVSLDEIDDNLTVPATDIHNDEINI
jgi:hypothetical protein